MFDDKSRYANLKAYEVTDHRGRKVLVVPVPGAPNLVPLGVHLMRQGQRVDHLAYKYLDDEAGFWLICELNHVMLPETLTEAREITIPTRGR